MFKQKRVILLMTALLLAASFGKTAQAGPLSGSYTNPAYQTGVPFGWHSHWVQPWRGYPETMPATNFLNGIGVVLPGNLSNPNLVCQMLAKYGVKKARIEIGWSNFSYSNESQII